jgi:hypothetical protein
VPRRSNPGCLARRLCFWTVPMPGKLTVCAARGGAAVGAMEHHRARSSRGGRRAARQPRLPSRCANASTPSSRVGLEPFGNHSSTRPWGLVRSCPLPWPESQRRSSHRADPLGNPNTLTTSYLKLAAVGVALVPMGQVLLLASSRSTASRAVMIDVPWKLPSGSKSRLSPEAMRSA